MTRRFRKKLRKVKFHKKKLNQGKPTIEHKLNNDMRSKSVKFLNNKEIMPFLSIMNVLSCQLNIRKICSTR